MFFLLSSSALFSFLLYRTYRTTVCLYKNNLRFYKNISEIVLLLSEIENTAWQIVRTYHAVLKTILVASVGEQVAIVIVPVVIFMINREKFAIISHKIIPDCRRTIPSIQEIHLLTKCICCSIHINLIAIYRGILSPAIYNIILFKCTLDCCATVSVTDIVSNDAIIAFDVDKTFGVIFTAHSSAVKGTVFYSCSNGIFFDVDVLRCNVWP